VARAVSPDRLLLSGLFGDLRGLSGVIWGFGVDYLGLFGDLRGLSGGVIFPTSWNFLGNHDDLGLFGDLAWAI
jgi:hypothetical protein